MSTCHSITEYRPVAGHPDYRVGADGTVWGRHRNGCRRNDPSQQLDGCWHLLAPQPSKRNGLYRVRLSDRKRYHVHRLVLEAFVGPRPPDMEGQHLDGDPTNNTLSNLRWGTPLENGVARKRRGRTPKGEDHHNAKLTEAVVRKIRSDYAAGKRRRKALAGEHHVDAKTVGRVAGGQSWAHVS